MYCCDLNTMDSGWCFHKALDLLPPYRRAKTEQFYFDKDKKMSVLTWLLLKYAMFHMGIRNFENCILFGKYGKPFLSDSNGIHFNLSHSNSMAFCAISDSEVGCDVEFTNTFDWRLISRFHFTELENTYLQKKDNLDDFFKIWTLKESFTKFTGAGLYMPLNSFSVSINREHISIHYTSGGLNCCCCFYYFKSESGYHFACCSGKKIPPETKIRNLDAHILTKL